MKKLNEFKAFELSKAQMNAIAGGIAVECLVDQELVAYFNADSIKAAEDYMSTLYSGEIECREVN